MLSEATFDQLLELPGVGPTRTQQFLQLRGKVTGYLLHNIGGVDWEGSADLGKKFLVESEGADVGLLGWVGKKDFLELGNMPGEVPMDTEKATSRKKWGSRF